MEADFNLDTLREFLALSEHKKQLASEAKATQEKLDALESQITDMFLSAGVNSMSVDGRLLYLRNEVYVGPVGDKIDLIEALKSDTSACALVQETYNAQTLRSWVNEYAEQVREQCIEEGRLFDEQALIAALPEPLRPHLKVQFGKSVSNRKA